MVCGSKGVYFRYDVFQYDVFLVWRFGRGNWVYLGEMGIKGVEGVCGRNGPCKESLRTRRRDVGISPLDGGSAYDPEFGSVHAQSGYW